MTYGEKMIWAAVYSLEWREMANDEKYLNYQDIPIEECVLSAWAAVDDVRKSTKDVVKSWGEGDEITVMLNEMLS